MITKKCPVCGNVNWDYDVYDGLFTWCGICFAQAKKEGFFERFNALMEGVRTGKYQTIEAKKEGNQNV